MAVSKRKRIMWTDTDRLKLVEAVIKVEEEIMNEIDESNQLVRPLSGSQTTGNSRRIATAIYKWVRIAKLLPRELQVKSAAKHKCKGVFFELVKVYKDKIARKRTVHSRRIMSKALWEILKKREELLQERVSSRQKSQNTGSQWTELACLQLIEAVMRVEEEDRRKKTSCPIGSSTGRPTRKWERILNFLPAELPWNCHRQTDNFQKKCRDRFFNLLKLYREIVGERSKGPVQLTKPVFEMMKKREDLLNSPRSSRDETSSQTASNVSTRTHSREDPEQLSQASNSFHTTHEHLPEERSIGTATQPAAAFSPERTKEISTMSKRTKGDRGNVVKLWPGVGHISISKFSRVAGRTKLRILLPCKRT